MPISRRDQMLMREFAGVGPVCPNSAEPKNFNDITSFKSAVLEENSWFPRAISLLRICV